MAKRKGTSIIFINNREEVLLFLRDDIPTIPFPNTWDLLGGHVEQNETPHQCIVREMMEEIELDLKSFHLYSTTEFLDRIEYVFWKKANFDISKIHLHEGQCLKWFTHEQVKKTQLAHGFNQIIDNFFLNTPFKK